MTDNIILLTDSYKASHWKQYPPKTTNVYSYFESRGGDFNETVFFGLQYILKRYLSKPFTDGDIREATDLYGEHFGSSTLFNAAGWYDLHRKHQGRLPVRIKAVPEGTRVPTHNVLMTIENTDPEFPWLTNFLETILSQVWYPTTVATLSNATRKLILRELQATGDPSLVDFKLHDFGFRGASSVESAHIGGAAHLVNFLGTDTVPAMAMLRDFYGAKSAAGFSVPASEHSTMTTWGSDREVDAYRNMVEQYGNMPFYSVVSDSYNLYNAAEKLWGGVLKDQVLAAEGTLVVRPDSGDPAIVCNHLIAILGEKFGWELNDKGFKVLNPKVRIIQGDGMDYNSIQRTLLTLRQNKWSADNITFGMGGGLLQKVNRDTQKFAFKCSSAIVAGNQIDVFKNPTTDSGKVSKPGRMSLVKTATTGYRTVSGSDAPGDLLELVYENGYCSSHQTINEIRQRATI